jgi:hypothetical protein
MAILSKYEIEAAWIKIKPTVEKLKRGDDIADDTLEAIGGIEANRIEPRLRRHFYKKGVHTARRGSVIHLLTDAEQREAEDKHMTRGHRQEARAYHANKHVDRSKLSAQEGAAADHSQKYLETRLRSFEEFKREKKSLMGAPVPNPRPQLEAVKK